MTVDDVAAVLGVPPAEVTRAERTPHGVRAHTRDGRSYRVDGDQVAYWGSGPPGGSFPVFIPPTGIPSVPHARIVGEAPTIQDEPVPDGSVTAVLEWVEGDPGRARAALDAEGAQEQPRVTLVRALHELLEVAGADPHE